MTTMAEFAQAIAETMRRRVTSEAPERPELHQLVGALLDPRTPAENPVRKWCEDPLRIPRGVISFRDEGGLVAELLLITHPKRCVRRPRRPSVMAPYGIFGSARLVSLAPQEAVELLVARGLLSEKWTDEQGSGRFFPVYGNDDPWSWEFKIASVSGPQDLPTLLSLGALGEHCMRRAEEIVAETVAWLRARSPMARELVGPLRFFWAHRGRRIESRRMIPLCWGSSEGDWLLPTGQFYGHSPSGTLTMETSPSAELWEMGLCLDRVYATVGGCVAVHIHARTWGGGLFWPRYETDSEFVAPQRRMP